MARAGAACALTCAPKVGAKAASASTLEDVATSACMPGSSCERCRGGDWPIGEEDIEFLDVYIQTEIGI